MNTIPANAGVAEIGPSSGYTRDSEYCPTFFADLAPSQLSYVGRLSGLKTPHLDQPFTYLELGCGQGLTTLILAECYPKCRFYGIDFNHNHIRNAQLLAEAAGINNVTFFCEDLSDYDMSKFPNMDYVVCHGVYSWVPEGARMGIARTYRDKLNQGGVGMLSYNSMPGWSQKIPIRRIMRSYTSGMKDKSNTEKAQHGLNYLKFLMENNARYFVENPGAKKFVEDLITKDLTYVAHEYLNEDWELYYFSQVSKVMEDHACRYIGSMPLYLNIKDLTIPKDFSELFNTAPNRTVYETHKSFVLNDTFRRDMFALKSNGEAVSTEDIWGDVLVGTGATRQDDIKLEGVFPVGRVGLSGPVYRDLLEVLWQSEYRVRDLFTHPKLTEYQEQGILNALHVMSAAGYVRLMVAQMRRDGFVPNMAWRFASRANIGLLQSPPSMDGHYFIASRVLGNAIGIDGLTRIVLLACDSCPGDIAAQTEWAHEFMLACGQRCVENGTTITDNDRHRALLRSRIETTNQNFVEALYQIGIVDMVEKDDIPKYAATGPTEFLEKMRAYAAKR